MKDSEYKKQTEPSMSYKSYIWKTAIGLQAVDGLKPSKYLVELANRNIKGEIIKVDGHGKGKYRFVKKF